MLVEGFEMHNKMSSLAPLNFAKTEFLTMIINVKS